MTDRERVLRELWERYRAGPFEDIPRSHVTAFFGAAYAAGFAAGRDAAAMYLEDRVESSDLGFLASDIRELKLDK